MTKTKSLSDWKGDKSGRVKGASLLFLDIVGSEAPEVLTIYIQKPALLAGTSFPRSRHLIYCTDIKRCVACIGIGDQIPHLICSC